jgi:putative spermidine/putrescine transport system substrate-binding protein
VIGTTWQVIANVAKAEDVPVKAILPAEGSTGWSDTWMISSQAENPNCAYKWMNYIISPKANAAVAEYFGEAPANAKACEETSDPNFCATYHANDADYAGKIWYWTTPISQCIDGRKDAECTDYGDWTQAWTTVKG